MYRLLVAALVAAVALPATAQTHLADSSGVYLGLGMGYADTHGVIGLTGSLGFRQENGLDYGVRGLLDTQTFRSGPSTNPRFSISPTVGYTADIGVGALLRVEGATSLSAIRYESAFSAEPVSFNSTAVGLDVSASVSRPIRTIGSVRLHPTVGLYATASRALTESTTGFDLRPTHTGGAYGVQAGLPISFRLAGQEITLPLVARFGVQKSDGYFVPRLGAGGIRINF